MTHSPKPHLPSVPLGRVLGIDPGLNVTGYAVVEACPRIVGGPPGGPRPLLVEGGVIRGGRARDDALATRLDRLFDGIVELFEVFQPTALALEQVHSHTAHPRTAILMAHARGVIMLAAARHKVPVVGYAATRIKKSLTGSGRAPKDQMQRAIQVELGLDRIPEPHDVADACAVALCHFQMQRNRTFWGL